MSRSPTQIALMLMAAALASVVVIAFVNAEAASRKDGKVPEIANGNLFSAAGNRVKRMISHWTAPDYRQSGDNETQPSRTASRRLAAWSETTHGMRHAKHRGARTTPATPSVGGRDDQEDAWLTKNASSSGAASDSGRPVNQTHDRCYDTTDVLYVIAITCVINFAFVVVIMTWVRLSTGHSRVTYSDSTHPDWQGKRHSTSRLCPSDSYSSVQEYVNSLPDIPIAPTSTGGAARYQRRTFSMEDLLFV